MKAILNAMRLMVVGFIFCVPTSMSAEDAPSLKPDKEASQRTVLMLSEATGAGIASFFCATCTCLTAYGGISSLSQSLFASYMFLNIAALCLYATKQTGSHCLETFNKCFPPCKEES